MKYYVVKCGAEVTIIEKNSDGRIVLVSEEKIESGRIFEEEFLTTMKERGDNRELRACFLSRTISDDVSEYWYVDVKNIVIEANYKKAEDVCESDHAHGCECDLCDNGYFEVAIPRHILCYENRVKGQNGYFVYRQLFDKNIPNGYYNLSYMDLNIIVQCAGGFIMLDDMNKFMDVVLSENPDDCWIDDVVILGRNKLRLEIAS
jgi:hypothetical protein